MCVSTEMNAIVQSISRARASGGGGGGGLLWNKDPKSGMRMSTTGQEGEKDGSSQGKGPEPTAAL